MLMDSPLSIEELRALRSGMPDAALIERKLACADTTTI